MKNERKIRFFGEEGKKYIKIYGDVKEICCSFVDDAILGNIEKIVKYYANRFFDFQHPTCEIEKTDDNIVGFYVFNENDEDDENYPSKYYYVQVAKIGKYSVVYKIDFTKEDFKLMP